MKLTRRIGNWRIGVIIKPFFFRTLYVNGITSDVGFDEGKHVIFWDFTAEATLEQIKHELMRIRKKFNLGKIYLFKSGNRSSYRAICLDKVDLKTMVNIICRTDHTDIAFLKWTMIRRSATIRVSPKYSEPIWFIGAIGKENGNEKSYSHAKILNMLYGIPIPENCDKGKKIRWVCYETIDRTIEQEQA
jgi:hypothetical protein